LLSWVKIPFVSDKEDAIIAAVKNVLPNVKHKFCWNHIKRNTKLWLQKRKATSEETSYLVNCIHDLLSKTCTEGYQKLYWVTYRNGINLLLITTWKNSVFWMHTVIGSLNPIVYNQYSGLTTNQSESIYWNLKEISNLKEMPVDCMIVALQQMQIFYCIEANHHNQRLQSVGEYHLKKN
jgi:hypothetical protein